MAAATALEDPIGKMHGCAGSDASRRIRFSTDPALGRVWARATVVTLGRRHTRAHRSGASSRARSHTRIIGP